MNDKVIVEILVPQIERNFSVLLPINKKMFTISSLLNQAINELSNGDFPISESNKLYNVDTLQVYEPNVLLYNTDIRNGTKLVLLNL